MRLVAADVNVRARGQRGQLADHVVQEAVGDLLVDAQRAEADLDAGVERWGDAVAVQLRIRGQRGVGVAGQVDLRHDVDVAAAGVLDQLCVLGLRVVAAGVAVHGRAAAVLGQLRPRLDHQPPALVVGQVQMQPVQLVERPSGR